MADRLERLINLVAVLLDARVPLPRRTLRELVPGYTGDEQSFRRAFERDKEALRQMGIPIVTEPIDQDDPEGQAGYRIPPEDYQLPDPGLEPDELAALHLAASVVRMDGAGEVGAAMWKLGGAPPNGGSERPSPVAALPGGEHLTTVFAAVSERRRLRFAYRGEQREVDPHRLAFRSGRWYLIAHDHGRQGSRSFRLDRFETTPEPGPPGAFERPTVGPVGPVPPWRAGDEEEVTAHLLVDPDHAGWAVAQVGEAAVVERRDDGAVVIALAVTNRAAFRSFALGFLDHAEVLSPPELRGDVVAWLRSLCPAG